jgi:predicted component of type VI protein secretion system
LALEYLDATLRDATAIRADLARRWRNVDDEIRSYPTPIARCDVQLTALLETREELRELRTIEDDDRLIDAYAAAVRRWSQL